MDIMIVLALATIGFVIAFATWGKIQTKRRLDDDNVPKSSLARSNPDPKLTPDPDVTDPYKVTRTN